MKKLIAMIGAAAMSFGLFADAPDPTTYYSTSFEANDAGCSDGTTFDWQAAGWETTFEDAFKLVNQDGELPYASGKVRRDEFFNSKNVNNKYLKLETGTNEIKHAIGGADRVFFDQLVKFTGFDEDPVIAADGAKIAVWLKATEENKIETNLYVTAGTGTTATNLQIDCEVAVDTWYRLTIKSLGNVIDTSAGMVQAGFLIYINGELATIVDGQREYHVNPTKIQKPADKFYENGQLFTAIDTTSDELTSVGYQGLGGVDDIIFSKDAPDFAAAAVDVTVTPIEGAIITVKDADGNPIGQVGNVYTIPQGDFTVTYAQAPGWKFTTVTKDYNTGNLPSGNVIDDSAEVIPEKVVAQIIRESKVVAEYAESELTVVLAKSVQDGDQIKFVEGCSALDGAYVFPINTTIDVTAGGNWDIKVPGSNAILVNALGAMPEKQIAVTFTEDSTTSAFYLGGNIYGNGRLDTKVDVAGITLLASDLTIGATFEVEDGSGAILESDTIMGFADDGMGTEYTITLVGTKAKVVTTTDIAADAFVLDSGYVLNIETNEIAGTDWYTYTQVAAAVDPVCEIVNGKQYESIADALADAQPNDTLKLLKDVAEKMVVPADLTIKLDMNGKTLQNAGSGYTIDNAGNLTVVDNAETKGTITHLTTDTSSTIRNLGTLVISDITVGGTYIGVKNDEGVGCNGGKGYGELTLNGVTYNGDDQAVQNWGKATLNGGTFGGAVFTWASNANEGNVAGETTILGGTFNAKVAAVNTYYDDAWPTQDALVTIKGGTFIDKVYGTYTTNYQGEEPVCGKIVVVGEIAEETINPAQFKYDASAYCEEGYKTVKLDGADYFTVQKIQSDVVTPDKPIGLGNGGEFPSEEEAQKAADKLDFDIDPEDEKAGLTREAVWVKAEWIGGAWMAVLEPKEAPVVDDSAAIEVTDTNFGATVENPVPGVYYGFVAADSLDGKTAFEPVGEYKRATGTDPLKLTAPKGEGNARFYKLNAALRDPTAK